MLDNFFLSGPLPTSMETGAYSPLLVLASYIVASFGSYAGLTLMIKETRVNSRYEKLTLRVLAALALGGSIWSMHFIAMLAYKMPTVVHYDPWLTPFSLIIAISVVFLSMRVTQSSTLSMAHILRSALFLGLGIAAMHYTGMAAMQMHASIRYVPWLFFLSIVIGIAASAAALLITFTLAQRQDNQWIRSWKIAAALLMGVAICGMHYTGAAAAVFVPCADGGMTETATQSTAFLAASVIIVTAVLLTLLTFAISSRLFLVVGLGVFFSLPLAAIVYQSIADLNQGIENAQKEQLGLNYHGAIMEVILRLQELRNITFMSRNGDTKATQDLELQRTMLLQTISAVDDMDPDINKKLNTTEGWTTIKAQILDLLRTPASISPMQEFHDYTYTLMAIKEFLGLVSDKAYLAIDPDAASNFLFRAVIYNLPETEGTLSRLRGITRGLTALHNSPNTWRNEDIFSLQNLYAQTFLQDDTNLRTLWHAERADANFRQFVDYHNNFLEPQLHIFQARLHELIYEHVNNDGPSELDQASSSIIGAYVVFYYKVTETLQKALLKRSHDLYLRKVFVSSFSAVAFLGYFTLLVALYRRQRRIAIQLGEMHHMKGRMQEYTGQLELSREELIVSRERAETANRAKSDFLANMSHELRTPLNSIIGMGHFLEKTSLSEEQKELANIIHKSSENLLGIVNNILDLSKIEAGEMKLEQIGFDPTSILNGTIQMLSHVADEKGLRLYLTCRQGRLPYLLGDPTRLQNILMNLIGNALKYTPEGHIEIRVSCRNRDQNHAELQCFVIDTGIGIPKARLASIFDKFTQADITTTRKYGGTGLGLAITKQLVEMMGGTIGVDSSPGRGSSFWFSIPFEITANIHEESNLQILRASAGTLLPAEVRILVAEDQPMNAILIKKYLQELQIGSFEIAENGRAAVRAFNEKGWDLILMDCHMPEMSGYDVTREIRVMEKSSGKHIPIIAMTADVMNGIKEECLQNGMDDFISKPLTLVSLKQVLGQWIRLENTPTN